MAEAFWVNGNGPAAWKLLFNIGAEDKFDQVGAFWPFFNMPAEARSTIDWATCGPRIDQLERAAASSRRIIESSPSDSASPPDFVAVSNMLQQAITDEIQCGMTDRALQNGDIDAAFAMLPSPPNGRTIRIVEFATAANRFDVVRRAVDAERFSSYKTSDGIGAIKTITKLKELPWH